MKRLFGVLVFLALLAGCKQLAPVPSPIPRPVPTRPATAPPRTWPVVTPTPGSVGLLPPPPPPATDPPPVGNQQSGSVTGNGAYGGATAGPTGTPTATPTPSPTPSSTPPATITATHVQFIAGGSGPASPGPTSTASPTPYSIYSPAPWKQYASFMFSPLYSSAKNFNTVGLPIIYYDDPMQPFDGSTGGATPGPCSASTSAVHDCQSLRSGGTYNSVNAVTSGGAMITSYSGKGLVADPTTAQFLNYWKDDLVAACNHISGYGSVYQYIFVDNNSGPLGGGFSGTPSTWDASTWGNDWATAAGSLGTLPTCFGTAQILTNTFGLSDSNQSTLINAYLNNANVVGGEYEECFTNAYGWYAAEDSGILAIAYLKAHGRAAGNPGWICYANNQTLDASANTQARMFTYASYLLVYDLNYSSYMASYSTLLSNISIFPESEFVPVGPTLTPSDPIYSSPLCSNPPCTVTTSPYAVTAGLFVQYYTDGCYLLGNKVANSCEVAVNPTGSTNWATGAVTGGTSYTVPNPNGYAHKMTLSGGGTMDGGTVSFSAAASSTLAPQSAEILTP